MKENIENIRKYFESGATRSYQFRKNQLLALQNALKKYENEFYDALNKDLGKSSFEAYTMEIGYLYTEIRYALKKLKSWMRPTKVASPLFMFPSSGKIYHQPLGVVLIMSPWNYPVQLTLCPLVAAIETGNCAVIKTSRYTANTSAVLKRMITETFSDNYITLYEGGRDINTQLLTHKFEHIFFTGSPEIGKVVMEAAAKNLTPVTLELGGKNPCIIDKTADLNIAAKRIIWGKCVNAGQTCIAPDYILIDKDVKEKFIDIAKKTIREFYGDDIVNNKSYSKIINEKNFDRLCALLKDGNIIIGGKTSREKLKIEPTIIDGVSLDDSIMSEEIFGPLLPILTYDDINEIYPIIKRNSHSLALYLFTRNKDLIYDVVERIPYGGGCINDTLFHAGNHNAHFGGIGSSGIGAYHGKRSFTLLTHDKYVLKKPFFIDFSIKYPPYKNNLKIIKKLYK